MKRVFSVIVIILVSFCACNSETINSPKLLAESVINSIKANDENLFISYFASYDDRVELLEKRNVPEQEESRILNELKKRKLKYDQIPHDSYREVMNYFKNNTIDPTDIIINNVVVKSNMAFGYEKWEITISLKENDLVLYIPQCTKYNNGILIDRKISIEEKQ